MDQQNGRFTDGVRNKPAISRAGNIPNVLVMRAMSRTNKDIMELWEGALIASFPLRGVADWERIPVEKLRMFQGAVACNHQFNPAFDNWLVYVARVVDAKEEDSSMLVVDTIDPLADFENELFIGAELSGVPVGWRGSWQSLNPFRARPRDFLSA